MDSEIMLDSELNKGSIFQFKILLTSIEEKQMITSENTTSIDFKGKRVLVVEEAYNGQEAVTCVKNNPSGYYDLILMNIMMPVMDGLEATREIRKLSREDCQTIPIIAMSANAFDEDVRRSLASEMNAHLSKPVNVVKLEETLAAIMKHSKQ